jgi:hypothetical protein
VKRSILRFLKPDTTEYRIAAVRPLPSLPANSQFRAHAEHGIYSKNWLFFGSDRRGETAAICMSILASAKRHAIEPFEYVRQVLIALSSADVELTRRLDRRHPEHFPQYRRDEAGAAARARKRRREKRRAESKAQLPAG